MFKVKTILMLLIFIIAIVHAANTPNNHFQIVPEILWLNWKNNYSSEIFIYVNKSNLTIEIGNNTPLQPYYSQQNLLTKCQNNPQGYRLYVFNKNESVYNNTISNYDAGKNITISIFDFDHFECKPGRYYTNSFFVRDKNNASEFVNLTIYVDIPISYQNNPQLNEGIAFFEGSNTTINSFYFNSSLVENATNVLINLSSSNAGIFLFEEDKLIAKSYNDGLFAKIRPLKMYEIRVNSLYPYIGNLIFSGINASVYTINLGSLNVSQENHTIIRLQNKLNILEENIKLNFSLYHIDEFKDSQPKNFTFFVGENTSLMKIVLSWDDNQTYLLRVYDNNDKLVNFSLHAQNIYKNASIPPEEYLFVNNPSSGIWKVEVKNLSSLSPYNITVYQLISSPVAANFTSVNLAKDEYTDVNLSIRITENMWDGKYKGYARFESKRGNFELVEILFNVSTPTLLINNSLNFAQIKIKENYGKNGRVSSALLLNNIGSRNSSIQIVSSEKLYFGNHSINISIPSSMNLNKYSSVDLIINFSYNNSAPKGTYTGWILINTTGPQDSRAYPKNQYNISVEMQLTDELNVDILEIKTSSNNNKINNINRDENVTVRFKIFYVNGSAIEAGNLLSTNNFTIWLEHANLSYRVPFVGSLFLENGTNPIYHEGDYEINFTTPANIIGGFYKTFVRSVWQSENFVYVGLGQNSTLFINNTAIYMYTPNSTSFSMDQNKVVNFVVNLTNYGERTQTAYNIKLNESCEGYSVSAYSLQGCSGSFSGDSFNVNVPGFSSCLLVWQIQSGSTNASACIARIVIHPQLGLYDPSPINISISVRQPTQVVTTNTVIDGQTEVQQEEEEEIRYFAVGMDTRILIEQGKNKTLNVKVKNLYSKSQTIKISVLSINSTWFRISPNEYTISKQDEYIYRIIFAVPVDAKLGDYKGKIKIESKHDSQEIEFTLVVLPGDDLKNLINSTIAAYELKLQEIESKFNETQNQTIKEKINEIKQKIAELKSYILRGDYSSAYDNLYSVKSLFDEIPLVEEVKEKKAKSYGNIPMILIGSSGFLFASVLGYVVYDKARKGGFRLKLIHKKQERGNELKEIKKSLKLKELEEEIKAVKEKEKELEEEIKRIEEKEKELERS